MLLTLLLVATDQSNTDAYMVGWLLHAYHVISLHPVQLQLQFLRIKKHSPCA
jgi:hypothetical protein